MGTINLFLSFCDALQSTCSLHIVIVSKHIVKFVLKMILIVWLMVKWLLLYRIDISLPMLCSKFVFIHICKKVIFGLTVLFSSFQETICTALCVAIFFQSKHEGISMKFFKVFLSNLTEGRFCK